MTPRYKFILVAGRPAHSCMVINPTGDYVLATDHDTAMQEAGRLAERARAHGEFCRDSVLVELVDKFLATHGRQEG